MKTTDQLLIIIEQVDLIINDENGTPLCAGLIAEARARLQRAYEENLYEEQQEARDAADERRTMRQENGHPQ